MRLLNTFKKALIVGIVAGIAVGIASLFLDLIGVENIIARIVINVVFIYSAFSIIGYVDNFKKISR